MNKEIKIGQKFLGKNNIIYKVISEITPKFYRTQWESNGGFKGNANWSKNELNCPILFTRMGSLDDYSDVGDEYGKIELEDLLIKVRCECGAEKCKTTHANWCPKYSKE